MPRRLLLVRHAAPERPRRIGEPHLPLSEMGWQQARALAGRLKGAPVRALYTSPYRRALETAHVLGESLGLEPVVDERLREWDAGQWNGLRPDEVLSLFGSDWTQMARDPHFSPPGGEHAGQVSLRVQGLLADLRARHADGDLLLVAHSGVLAVLVHLLLGLPLEAWGRVAYRLDYASLTVFEDDGAPSQPLLLHYNDTCHLRGLA